MPRKIVDKEFQECNEHYNELKGMTPDEMQTKEEELRSQIEEFDNKIKEKQTQIDEKKQAAGYKQNAIDSINAKIAKLSPDDKKTGLENALRKANDEKKAIDDEIKQIEEEKKQIENQKNEKNKELKFIEGFKKNKDKLEKLLGEKGVKTRFEKQLVAKINKKRGVKSQITKDRKEIKAVRKRLKELEKILNDTEKIKNGEWTEEMAKEWRELSTKRMSLSKRINDKTAELTKLEKEIDRMKGIITHCERIQIGLMNNEEWEEIYKRAARTKGRYVRKDPENLELETRGEEGTAEATVEEPTNTDMERGAVGFNRVLNRIRGTRNSGEDSLAVVDEFAQKHPRLAKIRDVFKNTVSSIKNRFGSGKGETETVAETTSETRTRRDEFTSGLHVDPTMVQLSEMIDDEVKRKNREAKEQKYNERHASEEAFTKFKEEEAAKKAATAEKGPEDDGPEIG